MNLTINRELSAIVGAKNIIESPDADDEHLIDHRNYFKGKTPAIIFPQSTDQVSRIVKVCAQNNLSVVPQGGNTGYGGGATPDTSGQQVLICLSKLNQIVEIDTINFTMTVEAGAILATIQKAAESQNMFFPLSIGAEGSCQIGGNISTNAGGLCVLKYGNTRDLILGLEIVLADGQIINDLQKLRKNNTGYNLTQLFCGAEGSLGIITGAILKTFPLPKHKSCMLLAFESIEKLCEFYRLARQDSADCISSFEYISADSVELLEQGPVDCTLPLKCQHPHYALVEFSTSSDFISLADIVEKILAAATTTELVADGTIAQSEKQRLAMWRIREAIPETERLLGGSIKHDISLPISEISRFLAAIKSRLNSITLEKRISVYGHIGDGNLHLNLLHKPGSLPQAFKQRYESELSNCIYELCNELGGSFSAEHGIGQLKLQQLDQYKDPAALQVMRAIKKAIDPGNHMNPGKLIDMN